MKRCTLTILALAAIGTTAVQADVKYTPQDNAFYVGGDVDGQTNCWSMIQLGVPPYIDLLFTNQTDEATRGDDSQMQWATYLLPVGNEDDPGYGQISGDPTVLQADENGNLLYQITTPTSSIGESYYRYPVLSYGDQKWNMSQLTGAENYYTRSGIVATNGDLSLTLAEQAAATGDAAWDKFATAVYGGQNMEVVYPNAGTNMMFADKNIVNVVDGNFDSYFERLGPVQATEMPHDFILVDLGEIKEREDVRFYFADAEHILQGTATAYVGENDDLNAMTEIGKYSPDQVEEVEIDGVTRYCWIPKIDGQQISANGRYICFWIDTVEDSDVKPYWSEITEKNMRRFSEMPMVTTTHKYPEYTSNRGANQTYTLDQLKDNDQNTWYQANGTCAVNDYVMIDLGEVAPRNIIMVNLPPFNWQGDENGDIAKRAVVEISVDGENWTQVGTEMTDEWLKENDYYWEGDAGGAEARYARYRVTEAKSCWMTLADFIVVGAREFEETITAPVENPTPMMPYCVTYYPKPIDPFYLDHLRMYISSTRNEGYLNKLLPAGEEIPIAIIEVVRDEEGHKEYGDTIAKTSLTNEHMKSFWTINGGPDIYAADAYFYTNPDFGVPERTGVVIDKEFVIMAYDLDKVPGLNIAFTFGADKGMSRSNGYGIAMFTMSRDEETGEVGPEYNYGNYHYLWYMHGRYITMRLMEESLQNVNVASDGSYSALGFGTQFVTSVSLDDIEITSPDWIEFEFAPEVEGMIQTVNRFYVAPNTDENAREGDVVFTSPEGATYTIHITQAGTGSGVDEIAAEDVTVVLSGDNIEVGYPKTKDRVTVYNAAGAMVADYALPMGGKFTIPAADLASGFYIVKVSGENSVKTVKIIK